MVTKTPEEISTDRIRGHLSIPETDVHGFDGARNIDYLIESNHDRPPVVTMSIKLDFTKEHRKDSQAPLCTYVVDVKSNIISRENSIELYKGKRSDGVMLEYMHLNGAPLVNNSRYSAGDLIWLCADKLLKDMAKNPDGQPAAHKLTLKAHLRTMMERRKTPDERQRTMQVLALMCQAAEGAHDTSTSWDESLGLLKHN